AAAINGQGGSGGTGGNGGNPGGAGATPGWSNSRGNPSDFPGIGTNFGHTFGSVSGTPTQTIIGGGGGGGGGGSNVSGGGGAGGNAGGTLAIAFRKLNLASSSDLRAN